MLCIQDNAIQEMATRTAKPINIITATEENVTGRVCKKTEELERGKKWLGNGVVMGLDEGCGAEAMQEVAGQWGCVGASWGRSSGEAIVAKNSERGVCGRVETGRGHSLVWGRARWGREC